MMASFCMMTCQTLPLWSALLQDESFTGSLIDGFEPEEHPRVSIQPSQHIFCLTTGL